MSDTLTKAPVTALKIVAAFGLVGLTLGTVVPCGVESIKATAGNLFGGAGR
jgi:hypothetical protein